MKVLILSCNTGEGHNSAAKAIQEYFENRGTVCDIKDALSFLSAEASRLISKGHVFIYKNTPQLFGKGYRIAERHSDKEADKESDESWLYDIMKLGAEKLFAEIRKKEYDTIISVHIFASLMLTKIRKAYNPQIKMYFVATDYSRAPGLEAAKVDAAFIPHEELQDDFARAGISRDCLIPTGIPVRMEFYEKTQPEKAKEYLGLPADKRVVLLMGGSMGAGPIRSLTRMLTERAPEDTIIVVICGNNKRLRQSLEKIENKGNLRLVGFTNQVSRFMDAAELLITKPGGLSSTEGATKRLPMIFVNAVPGCETHNLEFFLERGLADMGQNASELADKVLLYLREPERLEKLKKELNSAFTHYSVKEMYEYISEKARTF